MRSIACAKAARSSTSTSRWEAFGWIARSMRSINRSVSGSALPDTRPLPQRSSAMSAALPSSRDVTALGDSAAGSAAGHRYSKRRTHCSRSRRNQRPKSGRSPHAERTRIRTRSSAAEGQNTAFVRAGWLFATSCAVVGDSDPPLAASIVVRLRRGLAARLRSGLAVPMMSPEAVADAAKYRTQRGGDRSQHGGRSESRPRIGGRGQDKGKCNSTNDGNCPRAHDRSPGRAVNWLTRKVPTKFHQRCRKAAKLKRPASETPGGLQISRI